MALRWVFAATFACALLVYGFTGSTSNALQTRDRSVPTRLPREAQCPGFEGNSDLYGLGIRIGVYLQWFSAWISNTVNPAGAAANHDANAIFLTAITVASSVALAGGALQPAEAYLMLLLSNGFLFTVLSFLGLRLYLLQPSTAEVLCRNLDTAMDDFMTSPPDESREDYQESWLTGLYRLFYGSKIAFGFRPVSKFKHPALSWAGVGARSMIGLFIAILSVITWWNSAYYTASDGTESCTPVLFFFGRRSLSITLLVFFRVAAIILLVPIAYTSLYSGMFALVFVLLGKDWLIRHVVVKAFEFVRPGAWDRMGGRQKQILGVLLGVTPPGRPYVDSMLTLLARRASLHTPNRPSVNSTVPAAQAPAARPEQVHTSVSWDIKANELPPLSVLLHAVMSLWARGVEADTQTENEPVETRCGPTPLLKISYLYHEVSQAKYSATPRMSTRSS